MNRKNVIVMFGGVSCESEISVLTALQLMKNINKNKYNVLPIYINKKGKMLYNKKFFELSTFKQKNIKKYEICIKNGKIYKKHCIFGLRFFKNIDFALLCFHGRNGEDGTIQGLLEINNIPYSSSGVLSSALTLNKFFSKQILENNKINITRYIVVSKEEENNAYEMMKDRKITFPVIVKPNCLGSSIGISKAKTQKELKCALELAFIYDDYVLVEKCVENLMEVNCACFKYKNNFITSEIEQPIGKDEVLSYVDKYKSNGKGTKGMKSLNRICPANISNDQRTDIIELTKKAYKIFNCSGVVRIDYLVDKNTNEIFLNELNSIPGSFAFYLFEKIGLSYTQLIDMIIENSLLEFKNKQKLKNSIENIVF